MPARVALVATVTVLPGASLPFTSRVPLLTTVAPVKVLVKGIESVPPPILVRLPAPLTTLLMVVEKPWVSITPPLPSNCTLSTPPVFTRVLEVRAGMLVRSEMTPPFSASTGVAALALLVRSKPWAV